MLHSPLNVVPASLHRGCQMCREDTTTPILLSPRTPTDRTPPGWTGTDHTDAQSEGNQIGFSCSSSRRSKTMILKVPLRVQCSGKFHAGRLGKPNGLVGGRAAAAVHPAHVRRDGRSHRSRSHEARVLLESVQGALLRGEMLCYEDEKRRGNRDGRRASWGKAGLEELGWKTGRIRSAVRPFRRAVLRKVRRTESRSGGNPESREGIHGNLPSRRTGHGLCCPCYGTYLCHD